MRSRNYVAYAITVGILFIFLIAGSAFADSGTCGSNLIWDMDSDGHLIISGTGDMTNFTSYGLNKAPWGKSVKSVSIQEGVTSIGDYSFSSCNDLTTAKAMLSANQTMIAHYWRIGQAINAHKAWGNKFIDVLSNDIRQDFPQAKGYSVRNL